MSASAADAHAVVHGRIDGVHQAELSEHRSQEACHAMAAGVIECEIGIGNPTTPLKGSAFNFSMTEEPWWSGR